MEYTDAGIVAMTRKEFGHIILPFQDKLFRFAYSLLKSKEDAKDVVQDVLLKTWNALSNNQEIANVEAWCMRSIKHRSLDKLKSKSRGHEHIDDQHNLYSKEANPAEQSMQKDAFNRIQLLMNELSEKQQSVLNLRDVEGYQYKEIAEIMEIDENQVKVLLHRARNAMRTKLLDAKIKANNE